MAEKYLYFRTQATDTSDDGTGESACFPASSLMGMQPTARTAITLYFKNMLRGDPGGSVDHVNSLDNYDAVILNVTTETHATTMKAITNAIVGENFPSFLVIANDDSDATEYLVGSTITSCGTITVAAAYANS